MKGVIKRISIILLFFLASSSASAAFNIRQYLGSAVSNSVAPSTSASIVERIISALFVSHAEMVKETIKLMLYYGPPEYTLLNVSDRKITTSDVSPWAVEGVWTAIAEGLEKVPKALIYSLLCEKLSELIWTSFTSLPYACPDQWATSYAARFTCCLIMKVLIRRLVVVGVDSLYKKWDGQETNNEEEYFNYSVAI